MQCTRIATRCISSLVCVVNIGIYKIGCNIYTKMYLLKGHNPSYWIYKYILKVPIERKYAY